MLTKKLKDVDTQIPAYVVKGGVSIDPFTVECFPCLSELSMLPPHFASIDMRGGSLEQFMHTVCSHFGVDVPGYALLDGNRYLTRESFRALGQGFTLQFTVSPCRAVSMLWKQVENGQVDASLRVICRLSADPLFFAALDSEGILDRLLARIENDTANFPLMMECVCSFIRSDLPWNRLPVCVFTLSSSAVRDSSFPSVISSIRFLLLALNSTESDVVSKVLSVLTVDCLPHLMVSSMLPDVPAAALCLFNTLYKKSDSEGQERVLKFVDGPIFEQFVRASDLIVGKDVQMNADLVDIVKLRLLAYTEYARTPITNSLIQQLLELAIVGDGMDRDEWVRLLRESPYALLTAKALIYLVDNESDLAEKCILHNSIRKEGGESNAWRLLPASLFISSLVSELLCLSPSDNSLWLSRMVSVVVECRKPFEAIFVAALDHLNDTWSEVEARAGEEEVAVASIREMFWMAVETTKPAYWGQFVRIFKAIGAATVERSFEAEARIRREEKARGTDTIELRELLHPQMARIVRANRINILKQGCEFKKVTKSRKDGTQFWKLDEHAQFLKISDLDGNEEKIATTSIATVTKEMVKGEWVRIRITLHARDDPLIITSDVETVMQMWTDGLKSLVSKDPSEFSGEKKEFCRLLEMDLAVRGLYHAPDTEDIPPLPESFEWVGPDQPEAADLIRMQPLFGDIPSDELNRRCTTRLMIKSSHLY